MANVLFHEDSFLFLTSENVLVFQLYSIFLLSPTTVEYVPVKKNDKQDKKIDCGAVRLLVCFQFTLHFNFQKSLLNCCLE